MEPEQPPQEGEEEGMNVLHLALWRSVEVPPEALGRALGKELQERLAALRPALIPWDLTKDHTAFFLQHREDLTKIMAFVNSSVEADDEEKALSPVVRRYLAELRQDLREIMESGAVQTGVGSYFAIENHPRPSPPIRPQDWDPHTIAFIERLRPKLEGIIKARHVDHWLQTPLDIFEGRSPMQVIECGGGGRVLALVKEMEFQGVA